MRVLVAYASRYGSTQEIAERIAAVLREHHLEATVQPAEDADNPLSYGSVVVGSASYFFHWMKSATNFVRQNQDVLAGKPLWLFSSGPLGTEDKDAQGRDLRAVLEPKEIAEFRETVRPRDHRVFFGALRPNKLGFLHRQLLKLPVNRGDAIFPRGDFRDWSEVETWASGIAEALTGPQATHP